jgi:hypothetical protein
MLDKKQLKVSLNEGSLTINNISATIDEIDLINVCGGKLKVKQLDWECRFKRDINVDVELLLEKQINDFGWGRENNVALYTVESLKRKC